MQRQLFSGRVFEPSKAGLIAALLLTGSCAPAPENTPPAADTTATASANASLPMDVEFVETGGLWGGREDGSYRVIVRTGGREHMISAMTVEWLSAADSNGVRRIIATRTVDSGPVRLGRPQLVNTGDGWFIEVGSFDDHYEVPVQADLRYALGPPTEVVPIQKSSR